MTSMPQEINDQTAKTRSLLTALFFVSGCAMLAMTIWASLDRAVWNAGGELLSDRWFLATLLDAYLGFLTFYVWVAYKETTYVGRSVWFLLIMSLGNMAIAGYVLWQLCRWNPAEGVAGLLLRRGDT